MAKYTSRGARLTALALATGTLVLAGTSQAGAAPVPVPTAFGGTAEGTSIRIVINLPAPITLPAPLNMTIQKLQQDISFVHGETAKGITPKTTSTATAVLGNGNIIEVSKLLGLKAESSLDGEHSASDALLETDLGLIKVGVGTISSSVAPDSATSALTSSSSSSLARLSIGLGSLPASLPLKQDLSEVVDTLNDTVDTAQGSLNEAVTTALDTLDDASAGATGPVAEQIEAVKQELTDLLDSLQQTIGNLSANTDLVTLSLLEATEHITRAGSMVTAKATSSVGGLNILNGLVTVDAVKTESVSSANGTKGAAAADTLTTILGLKVGDVLDLKLTSKGLEGTVAGNQLPDVAKNAVQDVITAVNGVLATAGVQIVNGEKTSDVDPNGKWARSSSNGVGIVVNPLKAAEPLVTVQLVPAGTAVNAAYTAPQKPNTPPNKNNRPNVTPPTNTTHPRTGAELPLFAVTATGLAGAALIARRRRTVEA